MIKNIDKILQTAINYVEKAGIKVMEFYGKNINIQTKIDNSPVTEADLASHEILTDGLKQFAWPILSEEGIDSNERLGAELVWIIDPLDGTKVFIQQTGDFTIMVALAQKQTNGNYRPIIGVIHQPVKATTFYAVKGGGAWVQTSHKKIRNLKVSLETDFSKITMLTSRNHSTELEQKIATKLQIPHMQSYGSSLKACMIAGQKGHINLNPAPYTYEWDVCASDIIIHEAGGKFTDIKGNLINYNKKDPKNYQGYLASNGVIHDKIVNIINELYKNKSR